MPVSVGILNCSFEARINAIYENRKLNEKRGS